MSYPVLYQTATPLRALARLFSTAGARIEGPYFSDWPRARNMR